MVETWHDDRFMRETFTMYLLTDLQYSHWNCGKGFFLWEDRNLQAGDRIIRSNHLEATVESGAFYARCVIGEGCERRTTSKKRLLVSLRSQLSIRCSWYCCSATIRALYDVPVLVLFSHVEGVQGMTATSSTQFGLMLSNQSWCLYMKWRKKSA